MMEVGLENPSFTWSLENFENFFAGESAATSYVLVAEDRSESKGPDNFPPLVAYLAAQGIEREWELQYIAVAKKFRKCGLGARLLNHFVSYAQARGGKEIFLEVRESNQDARRLYQKLGFKETGLRRNYYSNPPEEAVLYALKLE